MNEYYEAKCGCWVRIETFSYKITDVEIHRPCDEHTPPPDADEPPSTGSGEHKNKGNKDE